MVISIAAGIPNFVLRMPQSFRGVTSGLLGNFNGDSNDDFIYPAGNRLRSEATDREIHSYGQACQFRMSACHELKLVSNYFFSF